MTSRRIFVAIAVVGLLAVGGVVGYQLGFIAGGEYEWTTIEIESADTGGELGVVDVRIADDFAKRYTGLSDTESLDDDEGMLFIHDEPGTYSYVMRNMNFPIDIVFIDEDGYITEIHSAPVEENQDDLTSYTGEGQFILEVNEGYMADRGITIGDRVEFDLDDRRPRR